MRSGYPSLSFDYDATSSIGSLPKNSSAFHDSSRTHAAAFTNLYSQELVLEDSYARFGSRPIPSQSMARPFASSGMGASSSSMYSGSTYHVQRKHQQFLPPAPHQAFNQHSHLQQPPHVPIHGHHLHSHQQPMSKGALFVGDLSFFASEADLRRLFSSYGKLKRAEIKRGRFGDSLMHGFVELDQLTGAQLAMRELDGVKFMGRRIRVHWAYSNAEKSNPRDREQWTQLHVTFTTPRIDTLVSEEVLDRLFSRFGEVADVTVKKHARTIDPPFQSGYAFVYFYLPQPAVIAAERLQSAQLGDVHFETALSFRSQRVVEALAAQEAAIRLGHTHPSQKSPLGLGFDLFGHSATDTAITSLDTSFADLRLPKSIPLEEEEDCQSSQSTQPPLDFDRSDLLHLQSQQCSDSSLSLYGETRSSPAAAPSLFTRETTGEIPLQEQVAVADTQMLAERVLDSFWTQSLSQNQQKEPPTPTTAIVSAATDALLRD